MLAFRARIERRWVIVYAPAPSESLFFRYLTRPSRNRKFPNHLIENVPANRLICFKLQVTVTERDFWRSYYRKHQTSCLNSFETLCGKFKHGVYSPVIPLISGNPVIAISYLPPWCWIPTDIPCRNDGRGFIETKNFLIVLSKIYPDNGLNYYIGAKEGTRTPGQRGHNPLLYQLSYLRHVGLPFHSKSFPFRT